MPAFLRSRFSCSLVVTLASFSFALDDASGESRKDLFPIDQNGKWGFINATGRIVIEPAFDTVSYFSEDVAAAKVNDRYGYIDKTGKFVIEPTFRHAFSFHEGFAWVDGGPTGFIDKSGAVVVTVPGDRYCRAFHGGLAKAMPRPLLDGPVPLGQDERIGFIDKSGQYAIEPQFVAAWDFQEGLAAARVDQQWGFIDRTGRFVIAPQYDDATYFSEGVAAVKLQGKTVFVDKRGKRILGGGYEDARSFREQRAPVKIAGKWGFLDKTGAVVIAPRFDDVSAFFQGRASFVEKKKYGYIDLRGDVVVQPKYDYGHFFLGELAGVTFQPEAGDGAGTGYINRSGKVIWQPRAKTAGR